MKPIMKEHTARSDHQEKNVKNMVENLTKYLLINKYKKSDRKGKRKKQK